MKKIILVLVVALAIASCKSESKKTVVVSDAMAVNTVVSESINVDVENSIVNWKGFKPTGEHYGTIEISEGVLNIENEKLVGGSFSFDMNTIVDTDMPADNKYNAKLVGHLKSADFFDVEKYPTSTFVITEVKEVEGKMHISGNLTIKATTKNITILAYLTNDNETVILKSDSFMINRADFDVRYGSKSFFDDLKDKFINDEFEMSFEVVASK